jgi:predicted nucleic acid-binding Zn ribbon protein
MPPRSIPAVAHALPGLVRGIMANATPEDAIVMVWPMACGSNVASRTSIRQLQEGVLSITVPDVAWRNELQQLRNQYLASLDKMMPGAVKSIEFVLNT